MTNTSRTFLVLFICANTSVANAEQAVILNLSDQPEKAVKVVTTSNTKLVFDIKGNEELIEKNRQRGVIFPVKLSNFKTHRISTVTGPTNENGSFKFERKFEDAASYTEDVNGNRVRIPDNMDDMVGLVIKGLIEVDGKMKVLELSGGNMDSKKKELLYSIFESNSLNETAPNKPLKVGDSFSTETPFLMPVPGQQPIQFKNNTKYTFMRIKGDLAIFDMVVSFSLSNPAQGAQIKANGSGEGIMKYNIKSNMQEKQDLTFSMKMQITAGQTKVFSILKSESKMEQYIFNPNKPSPNNALQPDA